MKDLKKLSKKELFIIADTVSDFLWSFEGVFNGDWPVTKDNMQSEYMIHPDGTFLEPLVEDEDNNWANRGHLLHKYRKLLNAMGLKEINDRDFF